MPGLSINSFYRSYQPSETSSNSKETSSSTVSQRPTLPGPLALFKGAAMALIVRGSFAAAQPSRKGEVGAHSADLVASSGNVQVPGGEIPATVLSSFVPVVPTSETAAEVVEMERRNSGKGDGGKGDKTDGRKKDGTGNSTSTGTITSPKNLVVAAALAAALVNAG